MTRHIQQQSGLFRILLARGISIGIPRAPEFVQIFPHQEIEVRRESLPNEQAFRFLIEHSFGSLFLWRITIDEQHEGKSFFSHDLELFVRMMEATTPERHTLILHFDRSAEFDPKVLDSIIDFRDSVTEIPVVLDTEHASWKSSRNQSIYKSLKLPHVFLDAPQLPGILKDATYHTGKVGVLRMLGRNSRTWFDPNAEERFQYTYSEPELVEISKRVTQLRDVYDRVLVTFCNRPINVATQNSLELSKMIGEATPLID